MRQLQQGDVLLKEVSAIPSEAVQKDRVNGSIVLAEGESTGHAHRILDVDAMFYEKDGKSYLKNTKTVTVKHEEHHPITVEPGIWEIGIVREKDWLSGMVSKVVD